MNGWALFVRDGDGYLADPACDGPWAEGALHGGAPSALLAHVLAREVGDRGLSMARITCEFLRPAPRGPLVPRIEVVRGGRRVTLLDAALHDPDGVEVTRARALFLAPATIDVGEPVPPPFPGPEHGEDQTWALGRPTFTVEGVEMRFIEGFFRRVGPATCWFRLRGELVGGEPTLPGDRVVAAGDFGNGIASVLSWDDHTFINADLTVTIEREPVDEWVALRSASRVRSGSVAVAESELWDRRGRIGRAVQNLLVADRGA